MKDPCTQKKKKKKKKNSAKCCGGVGECIPSAYGGRIVEQTKKFTEKDKTIKNRNLKGVKVLHMT